jgi:2-polyprenyl-3-methyl-5-hydroxy-6-metoxy-1,4-benzoquinol methylase
MLCPQCGEKINEQALVCAAGHPIDIQEGVLVLLDEAFRRELQAFVETFARIRSDEGMRVLDETLYDHLPYVSIEAHRHEWRLRRYDWEVVRALLMSRQAQRILDVGAWNGWLSNRLADRGHRVTAVDYFTDPYDGLGAMQFYPRRWRAIQMELRDLALLDEEFDTVVLNRCTHFFEEPLAFTRQAMQRLAPGGLLIVIGLPFYRDASAKVQQMARLRAKFQQYGTDQFKPMRGFLDMQDWKQLRTLGVELRPYRQLWRGNLKARWLSRYKPFYAYGLWRRGVG